jgi:hypothetical protein
MALATAGSEVPKKRTWMEVASQVGVFVGAFAVVLLGYGSPWGHVLGLAVQPFWFYTSINNRQWGLVAASFIYAGGWVLGVYNNFLR